MCGIVAGVTPRQNVVDFLLSGLEALEYRGYDSAGIAVVGPNSVVRVREKGRVSALRASVQEQLTSPFSIGIGHTRWATHGVPSQRNAHPHVSENAEVSVAVVHNGIIENHQELRAGLQSQGYVFTSDTDTEVIAHALHRELSTSGCSLHEAVTRVRKNLHGQYAFAAITDNGAAEIVATRQGAPLLVGVDASSGAMLLASDVSALLKYTRTVAYLEDGDVVQLSQAAENLTIHEKTGSLVTRQFVESALSAESVSMGGHDHYMFKEILEQPTALTATLQSLDTNPALGIVFHGVENIQLLACGTSYHAASVARQWFESIARIPCAVEVASEFHARKALVRPNTLVITVSQSGETADTKSALEYAKAQGMLRSLAVCNVEESALARMSDMVMYTKAGPEIGVASTKAFTTQLMALYHLALIGAAQTGGMPMASVLAASHALRKLPEIVQESFSLADELKQWSKEIYKAKSVIFLGRGALWPIALEGALKLKEVSYIHAEGYSAAELKHGPLALLDENMPVIVSVANDALLEKTRANIEEVRARGAKLFIIADAGCNIAGDDRTKVIELPAAPAGHLNQSALVHVVPLQLISYYVGLELGCDIDKPRNLAKSVTVE